ncbi:MAG: NYN domain-containing protein [Phycisphaerales bacterium]|nr:NYN domain-containing protein [Phycisphaerales bacterium]
MQLLIDGNNLLFAAQAHDPERPIGRSALCKSIGEWAAQKRAAVEIVFDGPAPRDGLLEQIAADGVRVTFSGAGVSADDAIRRILELHSGTRHLLVVSTDREVAAAARRRGATTRKSDEFWPALVAQLAQPPRPRLEPPEKRRGLSEHEAEQWLRDFGLDQPEAPPERRRNDTDQWLRDFGF